MKHDTAVFIGRFQPWHKGHLAVALDALKHADHLQILIGSANRARSTRNPFTAAEREETIACSLADEGVLDRVTISHLDDHPYDMQRWLGETQSVVAGKSGTDEKIMLVGHERDLTSFYLRKFPQWGFHRLGGDTEINATAIRGAFLEGVWTFRRNVLDWLPLATAEFLNKFTATDEYLRLGKKHLSEVRYRQEWGVGPFQCTDAIVVQSGHVLLVERGGEIGNGELALPGGHLNIWETLDHCAVRELFEETGIFGECQSMEEAANKLWPHFRARERFDDPHRSTRAHVITEGFLFKLPDATSFPKVVGADDAKRAFWMPFSQLDPMKMFDDHYFIIEKMLRYL